MNKEGLAVIFVDIIQVAENKIYPYPWNYSTVNLIIRTKTLALVSPQILGNPPLVSADMSSPP